MNEMFAFQGQLGTSRLLSKPGTSFCRETLHPLRWRSGRRVGQSPTTSVQMVTSVSDAQEQQQLEKLPMPGNGGLDPLKLIAQIRVLAGDFWFGGAAKTAWIWTFIALFLSLVRTVYAVALSFTQRIFWTALSEKNAEKFSKLLIVYGFAVIIGPILLAIYDWAKNVLSLRWRQDLSSKLISRYMAKNNYLETTFDTSLDNPDQRMTEDVTLFTRVATDLMCQLFVSILDFIFFSAILYRLYPPLLYVLVAYCFLGTSLTLILGRPLALLNRKQFAKEASLRYSLVRVRENAESVAFYRGDEREKSNITSRFQDVLTNLRDLIGLERNLGFLQKAYAYVPNVLPSVIVGPKFMKGDFELGIMSQIYFSYNHVLGDLGLIVSQFTSISTFAANVARVTQIRESVYAHRATNGDDSNGLISRETSPGVLVLEHVSTCTPQQRQLTKDVSFAIENNQRLLVTGASGVGKSSLMRSIAGIWNIGDGRISSPDRENSFFLPQRPYMVEGSLKENVTYPRNPDDVDDDRVREILKKVNLPSAETTAGGISSTNVNLGAVLSLGEQQRIGFARLLLSGAKFAILDESTSALDAGTEALMYKIIPEDVMLVSVSNKPSLIQFHDSILRLDSGGSWSFGPAQED
eukprot:CAMPEP_0184746872 /NCGR_PEP_ID=MMETSP0315-20130426/9365_1 /TAXON_ID=101924 /ORGANISM="Rhodosorus marinus, Strain UTEX LB 2760" /LENGTH=634 /DNA_ID=CAMNT_0027219621 /DNA_START=246 /DNA_END=2150 /DNA_ORIENTATION=-